MVVADSVSHITQQLQSQALNAIGTAKVSALQTTNCFGVKSIYILYIYLVDAYCVLNAMLCRGWVEKLNLVFILLIVTAGGVLALRRVVMSIS